jgi:two-component system response regulator FixJ
LCWRCGLGHCIRFGVTGCNTLVRIVRTTILDADSFRRNSLARDLFTISHVEPLASFAELVERPPSAGIVLVHDNARDLAATVALLADASEPLPIFAYADSPDPSRVVDALDEGAHDYLGVDSDEPRLRELVLARLPRAQRLIERQVHSEKAGRKLSALSAREAEVLDYVVEGHTNRAIGELLQISPRTVEIHRANMLNKLGVGSTAQAIEIAAKARSVHRLELGSDSEAAE